MSSAKSTLTVTSPSASSSPSSKYQQLKELNNSLQAQLDESIKSNQSLYVHISILERALHSHTKELGLIKIDNVSPAQALVNYSSLQTQIELAKKTLDVLNNELLHSKSVSTDIKQTKDLDRIKALEYELQMAKSKNNNYEIKLKI